MDVNTPDSTTGHSATVDNDQSGPKCAPKLPFSLFCRLCNLFFRNILSMDVHEIQVHKNVANPYVCEECQVVYETSKQFIAHVNSGHKLDSDSDEEGSDQWSEMDTSDQQSERLEDESEETESAEESEEEIDAESESPEESDDSDMDYTVENDREFSSKARGGPTGTEVWTRKNTTVWVCGKCHQQFKDKSKLLKHSADKHQTQVFSCNICDYTTKDRHCFSRHLSSHSKDKDNGRTEGQQQYSCDINDCNALFNTKKSLSRHQREVHRKCLECTSCDFNTTDRTLFNRHQTSHDSRRSFSCPIGDCEYKAIDKHSLNSHMERPHKKRPKGRPPLRKLSPTYNGKGISSAAGSVSNSSTLA